MNNQKLRDLLKEINDYIDAYLAAVPPEEFRKALTLALKEQDRDTRHACAEAVMLSQYTRVKGGYQVLYRDDIYTAVMNCEGGLKILHEQQNQNIEKES